MRLRIVFYQLDIHTALTMNPAIMLARESCYNIAITMDLRSYIVLSYKREYEILSYLRKEVVMFMLNKSPSIYNIK